MIISQLQQINSITSSGFVLVDVAGVTSIISIANLVASVQYPVGLYGQN